MRKLVILFITVFSAINLWAVEDSGLITDFCISDSLLNKKVAWDATKRWLATCMDSKNATIAYENYDEGTMIIKGWYKDTDNYLSCVREGLIVPYVNYELEINVSDNSYCAKYNKIVYEPRSVGGYMDYSYMSKYMLQRLINEMGEIKNLMIRKGEKWTINNDIVRKGDELDAKIKEAQTKMDDKTIPKKERKQYKKYYEENNGRESVYLYIKLAAHRLVFDTLLLDGNLESIIRSTITKTAK